MRELFYVQSVHISINMAVASEEESVELQCESSEFAYESGSSCDKTYAKLYRSYQFEPYKSDVEETEETSSVFVTDAVDTTLQLLLL